MRLYMIQCGGDPDYIEAETMEKALGIWRASCIALAKDGEAVAGYEDTEPDQVVLVHDTCYARAVLREGETYGKQS